MSIAQYGRSQFCLFDCLIGVQSTSSEFISVPKTDIESDFIVGVRIRITIMLFLGFTNLIAHQTM